MEEETLNCRLYIEIAMVIGKRLEIRMEEEEQTLNIRGIIKNRVSWLAERIDKCDLACEVISLEDRIISYIQMYNNMFGDEILYNMNISDIKTFDHCPTEEEVKKQYEETENNN